MDAVGVVLGWVLTVFVVLMLVRLVLDWVGLATNTPFWVRRVRAATHAGTEPVIAPLRRVLPPLRAGGVGIDLAFTVVFVVALILRSVAFSL
ncbi:MAG TPA: YggT family protein [Actinophytocola sp.]|jgi:YggT family protein|nr:YggT family protein [Actinophytocola sp.]